MKNSVIDKIEWFIILSGFIAAIFLWFDKVDAEQNLSQCTENLEATESALFDTVIENVELRHDLIKSKSTKTYNK